MEHIFEIIGSLLGALFVALLWALVPRAREWLAANTDSTSEAWVLALVSAFVRAAEQLYRQDDPTGVKRNQYVREQLQLLGLEITDAVIGMIEGAVWEVNTENKRAQVQDKALDGTESAETEK